MKQIIILEEFHSVIDVITNSSTELFIADTDKSVAAIEEFLLSLSKVLDIHSSCGVGEIYEINEENILDFVNSYNYYIDHLIPYTMKDSFDFKYEYYTKKGWDYQEWRNKDADQELLKKHSEESWDAYVKYKKSFLNKHKNDFLKALKGKTILVGSGDNSIPYSVWEILRDKLNAVNIHCG